MPMPNERKQFEAIRCPSCKGESFHVAFSGDGSHKRVITDCAKCKTRMSIFVKEFDGSPDKRSSWAYIEFSETRTLVD